MAVTLTTSWQMLSQVKMGSWGFGTLYLRLYGKYNSQSISANTTNYTIEGRVYCDGYYCISGNCYATVGGDSVKENVTLTFGTNSELTLGSKTLTVSHNNSSGECYEERSVTFRCYALGLNTTFTTAQGIWMPKIPRYANITKFDLSRKDETSATFTWATDRNCDKVQYSVNNGSWTDGVYPTTTVSGLSANTTYSIKIRVRSQDSQLWTESSSKNVTTYSYPFCTYAPDFVIGNKLRLEFYNPLNRKFQIQMWSHANKKFVSDLITVEGTVFEGFVDVTDRIYASIPYDKSARYNIDVHYNGNKAVKEGGNYYIRNTEVPNFYNASYRDVNEKTVNLTGNNQILIKGKSNAYVYIPVANKATSGFGAYIFKYRISAGNDTKEVTFSDTDEVGVTLNNIQTSEVKITAIDSRGLEKTIFLNAQWKDYWLPFIKNIGVWRENGIGTKVLFNIEAYYWNGNFGNKQNEFFDIVYQWRKRGTENWSDWIGLNNRLTIDKTQAKITANSQALNNYPGSETYNEFEIGAFYELAFFIRDSMDEPCWFSYYITINDGIVATAKMKNDDGTYSIGINGLPEKSVGLAIHGDTKLYNKLFWKEDNYGDKFGIECDFNDVGINNVMKILGATGGQGEDPDFATLLEIRKAGDDVGAILNVKGDTHVQHRLYLYNFQRERSNTWIPVISNGTFNYTERIMPNKVSSTDYPANQDCLATLNFLSFWNGAYSENGDSNFMYCHQGVIQAKPVILYENDSGNNGTVNLYGYASNFSHMRIHFRTNDTFVASVTIDNPNYKVAMLQGSNAIGGNKDAGWLKLKCVKIVDNVITSERNSEVTMYSSGSVGLYEFNAVYITKVEAWN